MKDILKKNNAKYLVVLVAILIVIMGSSFAWINYNKIATNTNKLKAGNLSLVLDESETNGINMEKTVPITDESGLKQEGYTFKLVNDGSVATNYTIYLDDLALEENQTRMPDSVVKYSLTKNSVDSTPTMITSMGSNPKRIVDTGVIEPNTTNTYTMKVWIDSSATNEIMGTYFAGKLRIEAEQVNIPVTKSDLVVDLADEPSKLDIGSTNISDLEIESSDPSVAIVDSLGMIDTKGYGRTVFKIRNKVSGEKKEVSLTVTKTLTATYLKQTGVSTIERVKDTCKLSNKSDTSCSVTFPNITPLEGYTAIGWNTDKTAHTSLGTSMNITKDTNVYTITKKGAITYIATFNKGTNGITAIGNNRVSCTIDPVYNDEVQETTCNITLPTISVVDSYTAIGWSEQQDATTGLASGKVVSINGNKNYYSVVKKNAITLTTTFDKNGAVSLDGNSSATITKSCTLDAVYNDHVQATSCKITTPSIEASSSTPIVLGFNEDKNATVASILVKQNLDISSNKTYYAITKSNPKTVTITFNKNGAVSLDKNSSASINKSCTIPVTYNGTVQSSTCNITSPSIEASSNTPIVMGFSTGANTYSSSWNQSTVKAVGNNATYYAQTYKDSTNISANFKIASTSKVSKIVNSKGESVTNTTNAVKETCTVGKTYNGVAQATSCQITTPTITPATGYKEPYFGTSVSSGSGTGSKASLTISGSPTYYANAKITSHTVTYNATTNGGTTSATTATVNYGSSIDLSKTASRTGYTFKGWNTNSGATTTLTSLKMGTSDVTLYAIFKDETAPVCSFSSSSAIGLNSNATLTLTCSDQGSGITPPTLTASNFTVSEKGQMVSVTGPSQVTANSKYSYVVTVKGIKAGTFNVSLKAGSVSDKAGNKNLAVTSSNVQVNKGNINPTVNMSGYTYGSTKVNPTVSGNVENGTVTYYYNTSNSNSGGTAWSTVTSATSLNAGTYYMYAVVGATANYNQKVTVPVKFVISKASGRVTLNSTSGSVAYGTSSSQFSVTGNLSSGALSVSDNNSTAASAISGTTVTLSNLAGINAGTVITVTVNSAATTNYNAASATYKLTIVKANISPTVNMSGYTFAGTKSNPSISGNLGNGTVTYYYNTSNSNSGGTAWSSVTSSSSLPVGTYYMYATVGATTNYNAATTRTTAFTIKGITRTIKFAPNGNTLSTPSGCSKDSSGNVTCSCVTSGTSTSCNITSPVITGSHNTPTVIGYSTGASTHSNSWSSNSGKAVGSSTTYYAQSKAAEKRYTATFTSGGNANIKAIGSSSLSCSIAETFNGTAQATGCSVTAPSITPNEGYVTLGWYDNNSQNTLVANVGGKITLTGSKTFLAKVRSVIASDVSYSNSTSGLKDKSGNNCTDVQCAIDSLNEIVK